MATSIGDLQRSINSACKGLGGVYSDYSCKSVSWDDVSRFGGGGFVSSVGPNITDTRLYERSGRQLFTVRSDNWNEKLGRVSAEQVALVVGNNLQAQGQGQAQGQQLRPITLREFLQRAGEHGAYVGVDPSTNLYDAALDAQISIRFQTTFLPIEDGDELAHTVFCTEAYNYNTSSDADPRNAVVLCTTQGIAFNTDRRGHQKLFHHAIGADGRTLNRYWLEAERTRHAVGGSQTESKEESAAAAARGKATASVIGIEAMGTRFNVLMTIQIPIQQRVRARSGFGAPAGFGASNVFGFGSDGFGQADLLSFGSAPAAPLCAQQSFATSKPTFFGGGGQPAFQRRRAATSSQVGTASAARVSRGPLEESVPDYKLPRTDLTRDPAQHITVTVVIYNVVAGGVPSVEDVRRAIDDMENLYQACQWRGNLTDHGADFMKNPTITPTGGYVDGGLVMGGSVFPTFTQNTTTSPPIPTTPTTIATPPAVQQPRHEDVTCDGCGTFPVTGTRYRCLQCPNFDYCETCELSNVVPTNGHVRDHVMLKVRNPFPYQSAVLLKDRSSLLHGVACSFCSNPVVGFRLACQDCHATICEQCDFAGRHAFDHRVIRSIRP